MCKLLTFSQEYSLSLYLYMLNVLFGTVILLLIYHFHCLIVSVLLLCCLCYEKLTGTMNLSILRSFDLFSVLTAHIVRLVFVFKVFDFQRDSSLQQQISLVSCMHRTCFNQPNVVIVYCTVF